MVQHTSSIQVGRACPQRADPDVFQARGAARRDGWPYLEPDGRAAFPRSRVFDDAAAQQRRLC
ncbi:MAG: hypothetical protein FJ398_04925 [Verrucomicrobia bacterium]|nr:hypothetical protein [Verrucomicrobiota bacterium]